jgi:predicted metallo-beta-lactamase superfamily hydrolase
MTKLHDLEPKIMDCWSVCNDLITIVDLILYDEHEPEVEDIMVSLNGMRQIYQWKFEALLKTYEDVIKSQHGRKQLVEELEPALNELFGREDVSRHDTAEGV